MHRVSRLLFLLLTFAVVPVVFGFFQLAVAQNRSASQDLGKQEAPAQQHDTAKDPPAPQTQSPANVEKASPTEATSSTLVLGPGDELDVTVTPLMLSSITSVRAGSACMLAAA